MSQGLYFQRLEHEERTGGVEDEDEDEWGKGGMAEADEHFQRLEHEERTGEVEDEDEDEDEWRKGGMDEADEQSRARKKPIQHAWNRPRNGRSAHPPATHAGDSPWPLPLRSEY
ncbi:MAG: hypothetical protein ACKV19_17245 [Verrucomicrobiales bacterium]